MFTFINSRLPFIENSFIADSVFSDTTKKYAKIVGVALAIFSTLTALYSLYRCYQAREMEQDESVIPPHITPVVPKPQVTKKTPSPKKPVPTKSPEKKKLDPILESPQKKKIPQSPSPKMSDEELAKKLQAQFLQEQWEDEDVKLAKELQRQYDEEEKKKKAKIQVPPPKLPVDLTPPISSPKKVEKPKEVDKIESPQEQPKPTPPNPFTKIEDICGQIAEKTFTDSSFSAVKAIGTIEPKMQKEILGLLNEIVAKFEKDYPVSQKVGYGQQVPAYFANVVEQGPNDRKYLSLVGIRNLLLCGPSIIDDFRDQKYLGGEHHYSHMKGLRAFKYYTGNVVDLDTEIDATNDAEAIKIAGQMIVTFGKTCGITKVSDVLTAADVAKALPSRKLELPNAYQSVYSSISNTDRSLYGVWKRPSPTQFGKTYYYVNVPNCDIVVLATLRLPYMLAELLYLTKEYKQGKLIKEFYDTLFSQGLSDKCFNDKAREFINFYHTWKAKLEDVPTPEEDARQKLKKGVFGEALSKQDPDAVIKGAYDRNKLIALLENSQFGLDDGFDKNGRSFEKWKADVEAEALKIVKKEGLWENVLYRSEAGKDYFLFNKSTFNELLKDFYGYLF